MLGILRIAASVGQPLGLLGLVVALVYLAYSRRLKNEETKLQALPADQRAKATDDTLARYGIEGKDLPQADKLALIREEFKKRNKSHLGYFIAALAAFVVCFVIVTVIPPKPDNNEVLYGSGAISEPSDRKVVDPVFDAAGTVQDLRTSVYLWLAIEINGKMWPKEGHLVVSKSGHWQHRVFEDGHPDRFALSLWVADTAANLQMQAWLDRCLTTGSCPDFPPVAGMRRLDRKQGLRIATEGFPAVPPA
jgi:hypothetical protein